MNASFGEWCCSYKESYAAASLMERSFSLIFGCASWLCELPQREETDACHCALCKKRSAVLVPGEASSYGCRSFHPLGNFSGDRSKGHPRTRSRGRLERNKYSFAENPYPGSVHVLVVGAVILAILLLGQLNLPSCPVSVFSSSMSRDTAEQVGNDMSCGD